MTFTPRSETVSSGTQKIGVIHSRAKDRHEVFGPTDAYICQAITLEHARRILFEMHRDSSEGLAKL
ncbi:hypothetical protein SAMN05216456_1595 [Devosia crocina]|uniref:Uncharacterized protein n=1 Tax=Devosia crocina TaxID=429728 RepID=A0A1I7NCK2_9HYPH|nr:hypothetical protein [Devosia crocina]SFV32276.1 hypothetical protein SAMN05216456_1595 [Devosia crocina]